jgi:CRISPR-associated protein Csm2
MKVDAHAIIAKGDVNLLVDTAQEFGKENARQLSTSQIRNIFGEVRRIEMNWQEDTGKEAEEAFRQAVLLQPKLAYQARRERGRGVQELEKILSPCLDEIRKAPESMRRKYFLKFVDFFEAILAYHRAAGGS